MRRFATLIALFVLSLSRLGAVAAPSSATVPSVGRVTHELVAPAPAVRLATLALRDVPPREPVRPLVPWLAWHDGIAYHAPGEVARVQGVVAVPDRASLGEWRVVTYDATAPPRVS
jgi:hypothetical protein